MIIGFMSRKPGISVPGFLQDIVRGLRTFHKEMSTLPTTSAGSFRVDSIEHSRDAKAGTSKGEGQ